MACTTLRSGQLFLWACSSFINKMSSPARLQCSRFHFVFTCNVGMYSRLHFIRNCSAMYWTFFDLRPAYKSCETSSPGKGPSGGVFSVNYVDGAEMGMAEMGRELTIAATFDIKVTSSSWVSFCAPVSNSMTFRMPLIVHIWCSQAPPKWDACGGLNCHSQPCSEK